VKAARLFGKGWKAPVWAAYEMTHSGRLITRERQRKLVNVPVSTQRYRDRQAGLIRHPNFAKSNMRSDKLAGLKLAALEGYSKHRGLYLRNDGLVGWRLPDSRTTDVAECAGRGRARKANIIIRRHQLQNSSSPERRALSDEAATSNPDYVRLFNSTAAQRRASERKLSRADDRRVREVYELAHEGRPGESSIWMHCPRQSGSTLVGGTKSTVPLR
jgi:hypothetical protein